MTDPTTVPAEDFEAVLEQLAESSRLLSLAGIMLDHSSAGIDRRDESIAMLNATLDQRDAEIRRLRDEAEGFLEANETMHADKARLIRQMTAMQAGS